LVFGSSCRNDGALGAMLAGVTRGALGLIDALGGAGNLPCWISEARCSTWDGNAGPSVPPRPPAAAIAAGAGAGLLITVLITVVLWMLLKMTLPGGART
jgi:hypothetical protein